MCRIEGKVEKCEGSSPVRVVPLFCFEKCEGNSPVLLYNVFSASDTVKVFRECADSATDREKKRETV